MINTYVTVLYAASISIVSTAWAASTRSGSAELNGTATSSTTILCGPYPTPNRENRFATSSPRTNSRTSTRQNSSRIFQTDRNM
uniref:Putative secreted protein n=1 Tax=Anopheles darlingi TaxID=43151 RepID=A0A2M4DLB7_ANODA